MPPNPPSVDAVLPTPPSSVSGGVLMSPRGTTNRMKLVLLIGASAGVVVVVVITLVVGIVLGRSSGPIKDDNVGDLSDFGIQRKGTPSTGAPPVVHDLPATEKPLRPPIEELIADDPFVQLFFDKQPDLRGDFVRTSGGDSSFETTLTLLVSTGKVNMNTVRHIREVQKAARGY